MSKAKLGLIAAASAATGAAFTALFYGAPPTPARAPAAPTAPAPAPRPAKEKGVVNPAGFFQYGA